VSTILYDFPENQLLKFHQIGMALTYQISHWYGGRLPAIPLPALLYVGTYT